MRLPGIAGSLLVALRRLFDLRKMAGDDAPIRPRSQQVGPEPEPPAPMPDDDRPGRA